MCCVDRLNSQPVPVIQSEYLYVWKNSNNSHSTQIEFGMAKFLESLLTEIETARAFFENLTVK